MRIQQTVQRCTDPKALHGRLGQADMIADSADLIDSLVGQQLGMLSSSPCLDVQANHSCLPDMQTCIVCSTYFRNGAAAHPAAYLGSEQNSACGHTYRWNMRLRAADPILRRWLGQRATKTDNVVISHCLL